ncbi:hypothetical protein JMJ35_000693 [Cladonia borealis]|uniref:Uncharacterized protein n=1 Tax=Cladonia borealis TaxID=184061 RepID=A0AA39RBN3_9LECA|nr:hypothetical protein JMJ35_000693 [Cladonia borealis]
MASNSRWPRSDMQSYAPPGRKSSAMSHATCWGCFNNDGSDRSFQSRQTAEEIPIRSSQQYTHSSEPRAPSPSPYDIPGVLLNSSDPSYPSIRDSQDYTSSSSTEKGRRTGTEGYLMQTWSSPVTAGDQGWTQSAGYPGQQQGSEQYYLSSSQPTQSDSYPTGFADSYQTQQYSSISASSTYLDNNRTPPIASPGPPSYLSFTMPVARPSIVVNEAQDDSSDTNVYSVSRRGASMRLDAHRSSTRTPNRIHRNHRSHNDMTDLDDLEESVEGLLSVPRAPRRGQREDDSPRRTRHLTPEGREHAKDVRREGACENCKRRKTKCKHVLERDQVSTPSSPGVQWDAFTSPYASSSPQPFRYHSPPTAQSALYPMTMNDFPYCSSPSPLPKSYTEQTYTDHFPRYQPQERYSI